MGPVGILWKCLLKVCTCVGCEKEEGWIVMEKLEKEGYCNREKIGIHKRKKAKQRTQKRRYRME